jgi:hypothetical protein
MMVIKQYKLDPLKKQFDYERHFEVPDELAYGVMSTDPMAKGHDIDIFEGRVIPESEATYVVPRPDPLWQEYFKFEFLYEAGKMVGGTFYIEYTWHSENGKLFK